MKFIDNLLKLFSTNYQYINDNENFKEVNIKIKTKSIIIPIEQSLKQVIETFPLRDKVHISITLDEFKDVSLFKYKYKNFIEELKNLDNLKDDDSNFIIEIIILKSFDLHNEISLYDYLKIVKFMRDKNLMQILYVFKDISKDKNKIYFNLMDSKNIIFYSSMFCFKSNDIHKEEYDNFSRQNENLINRDKVCHYLNAKEFNFCPDDFRLIIRSKNNELNQIFDKLCIIFSLIYISNISKIENDNEIKITIQGYKVFNFIINYKNNNFNNLKNYYYVYSWIYSEGNLIDKIGIARNIISLYLCKTDTLLFDNNILNAIKSNYNIYLQKNVQQYIQIKNKISETLLELSLKSDEIIKKFSDNLMKNIMAFLSFFVTVIIMSSITNGRLTNIFNKDITIISVCLLVISLILLRVSLYVNNEDKKRFKEIYYRIKNNYKDILFDGDIDNIFKKDDYINNDLKVIDRKVNKYKKCWIFIIVVIFIGVVILG